MNTVFRSLLKSTCGLNRPRYKGATSLCRRTQYSDSLDYSPDSSYGSEKIDDHKRGDENDFSSRQVGQSREGPRYRTSFAEYVKNYGYADFRSVAYVQKMRSVGDKQPVWRSKGLINGKIEDIDSGSLLGRWVVMFFYPLNFTFVCPTEIHEASDLADDFRRVNAVVVGVSVDSVYSHRAWSRIPRAEGGVEGLDIILVSDLDRTLTRKFGILSKSNPSVSNRATFIINPEGVIMHVSVNESSIGRNFSEILRMLKGLQYSAQFGEVCPAKWKEGDKGIAPNAEAYSEWYNESQ